MMSPLKRSSGLAFLLLGLFCIAVRAQNFNDVIGVTLLRAVGTNINGTGVRVGQVEAGIDPNQVGWEVEPDAVPEPTNLFTWYADNTSSTQYPNGLGTNSGHATVVGQYFYGPNVGVATNVAHVDNYDANYFLEGSESIVGNATNYTFMLPSYNINDPVVNQSFLLDNIGNIHVASNEEAAVDSAYDTYAATYGVLFVSGAGNGGPFYVNPPASCYNGIGVGVYNGPSSIGPAYNGESKPDIVANGDGGDTSFSAPLVAGAAAALVQAGRRGDGGGNTNAANMITVKALLLNGAVKPVGWANVPPSPLDYRYGAGFLNVFNSYEQLAAGQHSCNFSTNIPTGTAHPPVVTAVSVPVLNGWDFATNNSSASADHVNHYFFNVTNSLGGGFELTTTLVWNRHANASTINNLELFLYNAANSNLVASSTSVVDNVQHVFLPTLPQGRYDLQVWKAGGAGIVSTNEPYALAWGITQAYLHSKVSSTNLCLSWPVYPARLHCRDSDRSQSANPLEHQQQPSGAHDKQQPECHLAKLTEQPAIFPPAIAQFLGHSDGDHRRPAIRPKL